MGVGWVREKGEKCFIKFCLDLKKISGSTY